MIKRSAAAGHLAVALRAGPAADLPDPARDRQAVVDGPATGAHVSRLDPRTARGHHDAADPDAALVDANRAAPHLNAALVHRHPTAANIDPALLDTHGDLALDHE
jgi:hypothetical protein